MDKSKTNTGEGAGDVGSAGRDLTGRLGPSSSSKIADSPTLKPNADPLSAVKKPQPAVIWDDKNSTEQQRVNPTFYNDTTPPPSPSYVADSNNSLPTGFPPAQVAPKENGYDYKYDHVAPPAPIPSRDRICGLRKRWVWAIIGVATVVILALAIGLGVGLTAKNRSSGGGSADGQDSAAVSSSTATSSSSSTATSTKASTSTATVAKSDICPAANNTVFEVPGSDKSFLRICGIDYSSQQGTKDLATVWTASIQDCIVNCAGYNKCTACGWGVIPGDSYRDNHRCFLKTHLGKPQDARPGWDFAILQ